MNRRTNKVVSIEKISLQDRLSLLTYREATNLLGDNGAKLINSNSNTWSLNPVQDIVWGENELQIHFPEYKLTHQVIVIIKLHHEHKQQLSFKCNSCENICSHLGAAFSFILEEKTSLGLAVAPPDEVSNSNNLNPIEHALNERVERSQTEKMHIKSSQPQAPWVDYTVTSKVSGKIYKVALRGLNPGDSYCSCPDFRTNTLGTCKHIMRVVSYVRKKFNAATLKKVYRPSSLALHLQYAEDVTLRLLVPHNLQEPVKKAIKAISSGPITDMPLLLKIIQKLELLEQSIIIFPDAEEFIQQRLTLLKMSKLSAEIRNNPADHPLRTTLLQTELLPYQMDGIGFAAGALRSILADEMGLGKTIQGIGFAELLAQQLGIKKVLVVCPASLKSQWKTEIHKFCSREAQLISGPVAERSDQYANPVFFTICNYEQVLRDHLAIERTNWDLIILDEAQRIKNWETKTSRMIKSLRSRFALVLTGTPLENRLDDLYSIVQFVDDRCLGPGFRFFQHHRITGDKGKIIGIKHLDEIREKLKPVLLRRTRDSVKLQLPPKVVEIVRFPVTEEQSVIHNSHLQLVASIIRKPFLTEMDLIRLQKELLMCRLAANSTVLVDKKSPGYSSKLERLDELLSELLSSKQRKIVLFSEWTGMLDLIEPIIKKYKAKFVRLDGGVPQRKRQDLVQKFQNEPDCQLFLTTNAGSVGLNLQAANTVINVDLPWNPAVLEQRIARAHRMGQKQSVHVYVLVTEGTIEENLLGTIAAKKDLALAALDTASETNEVMLESGLQNLKNRLELLLGNALEAHSPLAALSQDPNEDIIRKEKVAAAGGQLLGAAFKLLSELITPPANSSPPDHFVLAIRAGLQACTDGSDQPKLTISLPDQKALDDLSKSLAALLLVSQNNKLQQASSIDTQFIQNETVSNNRFTKLNSF